MEANKTIRKLIEILEVYSMENVYESSDRMMSWKMRMIQQFLYNI